MRITWGFVGVMVLVLLSGGGTRSPEAAAKDEKTRNPFGVNDIQDPNDKTVQDLATKVKLTGDDKDANAEQWVKEATAGKKGRLRFVSQRRPRQRTNGSQGDEESGLAHCASSFPSLQISPRPGVGDSKRAGEILANTHIRASSQSSKEGGQWTRVVMVNNRSGIGAVSNLMSKAESLGEQIP